ncbi:MarC family protein [Candidatus Bathyarchaeota archaeon]|nr:MarC family protein [Candidatus Bathyarchaeota archaeon]
MLPDLTRSFISLFIIVDPFGNIPIFIGLTEGISSDSRRRIFHIATITGFILLLAFALAGREILSFFGITLQSFMIAGGILLLIIAVRILVIGGWEERSRSPESIGVVPIAVPLLVGPGAITTTIINLETYGILTTIISVVLVFIIVWLTLRFIEPIYRVLGRSGSIVIARVMALLIAAIAVQFIIEGLENLSIEAP